MIRRSLVGFSGCAVNERKAVVLHHGKAAATGRRGCGGHAGLIMIFASG